MLSRRPLEPIACCETILGKIQSRESPTSAVGVHVYRPPGFQRWPQREEEGMHFQSTHNERDGDVLAFLQMLLLFTEIGR